MPLASRMACARIWRADDCDKMQCVMLVHARTQQLASLVTCGNASKGSGSCCSAGSSQLGRAGKLLMITVVVWCSCGARVVLVDFVVTGVCYAGDIHLAALGSSMEAAPNAGTNGGDGVSGRRSPRLSS